MPTQLILNFHRTRMELLGAINVGRNPKTVLESIKGLLLENELHIFREGALKRLEQLELELLGLPELQRIVCYFEPLWIGKCSASHSFNHLSLYTKGKFAAKITEIERIGQESVCHNFWWQEARNRCVQRKHARREPQNQVR